MCTLLIAIEAHPDFPLVIAANRDEFHSRPAKTLHWWPPDEEILAGQDQVKGGIWLGLNRSGQLAAVTNVREVPLVEKERSRGQPPREFLRRRTESGEFLDLLSEDAEQWPGFNMLLGDPKGWWWFSNRLPLELSKPQAIYQRLPAGVHGLSNGSLNSNWPKVRAGRQALKELLDHGKPDSERLFKLLYNRQKASDDQLPSTGVALERERFLSSLFIQSEDYGTRCSTLCLRDNKGHWQVVERSFAPSGDSLGERTVEFDERNT